MRALVFFLVFAVGGCKGGSNGSSTSSSGSNGSNGSGSNGSGSIGSTGLSGGNGGNGGNGGASGSTGSSGGTFTCTPFSSWCDGNMLMNCTKSGADATGWDCTKSNTSSLTWTCASACPNEPSSYGACCTYTTTGSTGGTTGSTTPPTCAVSLTAPSFSGDSNSFATGVSCSPPSAPECPNMGYFAVNFYNRPPTCPPSGYEIDIEVDRSKATPGTSPVAAGAWSARYYDYNGTNLDCSDFTGSVIFYSDTPSWKVGFDITCTGGPSLHLAGTMNGTVQ